MKPKFLTATAAVALVMALSSGPAYAQVSADGDASVGSDGVSAGVGASIGGTGGVSGDGSASVGGDGADAGASASIGGTGGVSGDGSASVGGDGADAGASASIGGTGGISGDGSVSVGDDGIDAEVGVSIGGTGAVSPGGSTTNGAIDAIGTLASLSAGDLHAALSGLSSADVMKLKLTCAEVLRNPAVYSASTRAVCQVIASL